MLCFIECKMNFERKLQFLVRSYLTSFKIHILVILFQGITAIKDTDSCFIADLDPEWVLSYHEKRDIKRRVCPYIIIIRMAIGNL